MYDILGDIHGHADELEALLKKMNYEERGGCYRHSERTAIFVGDLIDRGPKIRRVVEVVRAMVDGGAAKIVMGNHEFNAICYHTPDPQNGDECLRPHTKQNIHQHAKTLEAFSSPGEMDELVKWFYSIPLWLETDEFRVVHACWHPDSIQMLRNKFPDGFLKPHLLADCARKDGTLYGAIETVLKGPEVILPDGVVFHDKDGHERREIRVKWFLSPAGQTYRSYSFPEQLNAPETEVDDCDLIGYGKEEPPVFFGHYWLPYKEPKAMADNCFCLDFSVAKGGFLCAYRRGIGFVR